MKFRSAWVTLTGKVFVSEPDLEDYLAEQHPDLAKRAAEQDESILCFTTPEQERAGFEHLANEEINEKLGYSDDPIKLNDVSIDLSTLR